VNEFTPSPEPRTEQTSRFSLIFLLNFLGKMVLDPLKNFLEALSFLGEVTIGIIKILIHPRRLRFITLVDLIHKVGASALPIVGLISFLIGVVLVYQGADQLRRFGAEIFTINLLAVSALRELGILLTAIVVAGRSGSAYTAQLGFMKLNQEIDALHVLGIDPIEVLVVPRILALLIVLPLLTFFADIMALIGGGIATYFLIGVGPDDFAKHLLLSIGEWTFWTGIIKAPVFAFFIGLVACFEGLRVSGGAESVGQHTTQSVVEGIFLVIIFDAAFSILFSVLGI
jgi:phospholipid/cholesterol/gamma-HCH transport system permease protein